MSGRSARGRTLLSWERSRWLHPQAQRRAILGANHQGAKHHPRAAPRGPAACGSGGRRGFLPGASGTGARSGSPFCPAGGPARTDGHPRGCGGEDAPSGGEESVRDRIIARRVRLGWPRVGPPGFSRLLPVQVAPGARKVLRRDLRGRAWAWVGGGCGHERESRRCFGWVSGREGDGRKARLPYDGYPPPPDPVVVLPCGR